jgi:membrane carboxypeptidase/penicillin-binding protein
LKHNRLNVSYERKIREMIVASRVESTLSKPEILELYLNSAYLGRVGAWKWPRAPISAIQWGT